MGRATTRWSSAAGRGTISIHALRGEGDREKPAAGADHRHFYPRPPWGGRPGVIAGKVHRRAISIHALRGEGDKHPLTLLAWALEFLSTPSVGRATLRRCCCICQCKISIHALRGEGDPRRDTLADHIKNFYPRPPWGGRQVVAYFFAPQVLFLSTPSVGRATVRRGQPVHGRAISIHALRGEGD